jgi:hypothetical protein
MPGKVSLFSYKIYDIAAKIGLVDQVVEGKDQLIPAAHDIMKKVWGTLWRLTPPLAFEIA